jgi:hypothetical protein
VASATGIEPCRKPAVCVTTRRRFVAPLAPGGAGDAGVDPPQAHSVTESTQAGRIAMDPR